MGLKENVIIGKLIPAGTGMKLYRNVNVDYGVNTEFMETYKELMEAEEYEEEYDEDDFTMDPDDFDQQLAEEAFAEEVQGLDDSGDE